MFQIGHKKAEEFTFHWWDHVFNKASSSLQVESGEVVYHLSNFSRFHFMVIIL